MIDPRPRIEPLQVLRGLAAFLIMAKHGLYEVSVNSPLPFDFGNYKNYTVGIDIFFVLSGFIMVYTSWGQAGLGAAKSFIWRRLIRIVPVYWFYTFALLAVALLLPQVLGKAEFVPLDFVKSLFFVPYINTAGDMQPFLANGWSLNYEMYFYALFAFTLLLPVRYSFAALAIYFFISVQTNFFGVGGVAADFYGQPIVLEFLAGAFIGVLFKKNIRLPALFFGVGGVFVVLSMVALLFTDTLMAHGIHYSKPLVGVLSVALLVLPKGAEYIRMPKLGVMSGDASYTIYLSHPFALGAVTQIILLLGLESTLSPWISFALCVLVSMIGGYIAYLIIEKPMTQWLKQLIVKPKQI